MEQQEQQVISFAIHNPHAPNIQCGVMVMIDPDGPMVHKNYQRCPESAEMAVTGPAKDGSNRYIMAAYCHRHWQMAQLPEEESGLIESLADA